MGKLSEFSVRKPITILMSVLIIIILGVVSLTRMTTELLPSMNLPYAIVTTQYVGASPEQVELGVTKPLEGQLATVSNIKNIQSISQEHFSLIILEFNESTNMDSAMIEMRENLDMLTNYLPDGVGNPMIIKINPDMMPIMNFSLSFEGLDATEATTLIEDEILPRLERIPGVAQIDISGLAEYEVQLTFIEEKMVEVEAMLGSMELSAEDLIINMIKGQNIGMPLGYVNKDGINYLIRVGDQIKDLEELQNLVILSNPQHGISYRLKDLATVEFVNTNLETYSKVNGENAITFSIQKQNNYSTTEVVELIQKEMNMIEEDYTNSEFVVLMDQAEYINVSVNSVLNNLLMGGVLALIILFVFLKNLKSTLIIGVAIPISVMAAFILIYFSGINLNIISMGGLALGIGMLVDNSIVVIENIYRLRSEGASKIEAAVKGASQVAGAIIASTLTTVAVFLPIVFLEGLTAQIFKEMALTITYSLGASLVIALTVVPTMSSKLLSETNAFEEKKGFLEKVKAVYAKFLKLALKYRKSTLLLSLLLLVLSVYASVQVGTEFFPASASTSISVTVNLDEGIEYEEAAQTMDTIVESIMGIEDIEYVGASLGGGVTSLFTGGGSSQGSINILLKDDAKKSISEVTKEIRELGEINDYDIIVNGESTDMAMIGGSGISIKVKGQELTTLESIANDLAAIISSVEGTTEVNNGVSKTSPEVKVTVDKEKAAQYQLTVGQVLGTVASMLTSDEVVSQLNINGRQYDITILNDSTVSVDDIKNLVIMSPLGISVPLKDIATIDDQATGFGTISRENQSRYINVTAKVEQNYNVGKVSQEVLDKIEDYETPDGYQIIIEGAQEQITSALSDLTLALILGVVLIYMIMAAQFQSLLYPFIVMFTIPLAFTGGFAGLFITQTPISVVAFIGLIILTGIVVNNGIVLVDYVNQLKAEGKSTYDALIEAGLTRLRPILMTALTTILGLATMALGIGEGAEMMQPMAITTIGGLLYATILTLVIIPVIYYMFDRKGRKQQDNK